MKLKALIIIALLFSGTAFGQTDREARFKGGDDSLSIVFMKVLDVEFHKSDVSHSCINSTTFAQFSVNEKGFISDIKFYEAPDTPPAFRQILTALIKSTDGRWWPKIVNGKSVTSKPFILPLTYQLWAGCDVNGQKLQDLDHNAMMRFLNDFQNTGNNLHDLSSNRGCVMLKPLSIFSRADSR